MPSPVVADTNSTTATPPRRSRKPLLALAAVLCLAAVGSFWWSEHKYEYVPKRWGVVVPGKIYRSGQLTPQMLGKTLQKYGIKVIVDMQLNDPHEKDLQAEMQYAAENGIQHYRYELGGNGTGKVVSYVNAVAMLIQCEREDRPVLVHCAAGSQRTGGVVACYRLLVENADPKAVYEELQQYDWNPEEDQELLDYLNANLPRIAEMLIERGAIDPLPNPIPHLGQ